MTSAIPIIESATATANTTSSSTTPSAPSNTLGPDSFITLLTAQLKTQDPLNPMDPNQMVTELTAINTLQQIVQIRTDMDALVGALPPGQNGTGTGTGSATSATNSTNSVMQAAAKKYSQASFNSQSF
jgi:flagellar basal-body rod modification protein FlgD